MEGASFGILQSIQTWYGAALMGLIAVMSVYMVALAIIRFGFFRSIKMDSHKLMEDVVHSLESGEVMPGDAGGRRKIDPPLKILAYIALANRTVDGSDLTELMKVTLIRQ